MLIMTKLDKRYWAWVRNLKLMSILTLPYFNILPEIKNPGSATTYL